MLTAALKGLQVLTQCCLFYTCDDIFLYFLDNNRRRAELLSCFHYLNQHRVFNCNLCAKQSSRNIKYGIISSMPPVGAVILKLCLKCRPSNVLQLLMPHWDVGKFSKGLAFTHSFVFYGIWRKMHEKSAELEERRRQILLYIQTHQETKKKYFLTSIEMWAIYTLLQFFRQLFTF